MQANPEGGRRAGKDFRWWCELRSQVTDVVHSGQSGDGHERQQAGNDQKKEVVTGINGRKTEQKRDYYVKGPGLTDLQAKGRGISSISFRTSSPLSTVS